METRNVERWTLFTVGIPMDPHALRTLFSYIKTNIIGFNLVSIGGYWNVSFVPETMDSSVISQLRTTLSSRGYQVNLTEVYGVQLPNVPQSFYNSVLVPFADRGIASDLILSSASGTGTSRLFFSIDTNPDLALEVLNQVRSETVVA